MDTPREAARETIARLREIGIERMVMISGDDQRVAEAVAREVGLDEARGDLMPDDKVETIRRLSRRARVAMVGDGVNDAPAMATATVGIAMGRPGATSRSRRPTSHSWPTTCGTSHSPWLSRARRGASSVRTCG